MEIGNGEILSYFDKLPNEVRIQVLSLIDSASLLNFCEAYPPFTYLCNDKDVIHRINFYKQYKLDGPTLHNFLTAQPRFQFITVLNINCLFWIAAADLRKCIVRLPSLQCLYALDTKLGVTELDCTHYKSIPNLKKVALSLLERDFTMRSVLNFPKVRAFYFHVYDCSLNTLVYLKKLVNLIEELEEVWLIDTAVGNQYLSSILYHLPTRLKKATLLLSSYIHIATGPHLRPVFKTRKRATQLSFIQPPQDNVDIYGEWDISDPVWDSLVNQLRCELPFGREDAEVLAMRKCTLENIFFEELNFAHTDKIACCIRLQKLINQVLTSDNTKYLKKLSINFCMCDETWRRDTNLEPCNKKPKRKDSSDKEANLVNIIKQCPLIEELEIWGCEQAWGHSIPSLKHISKLAKLKSLSLIDIPLQVDGTFLIDACKSCSELRSLRITPLRLNTKINVNILEALQFASNLRDFRFEHMYIGIDQVIEVLLQHTKLERLFLKCTSTEHATLKSFKNFVDNNAQLVFIMIVIKELPLSKIRLVQQTLHKYKEKPSQLFLCRQEENCFTGKMPVPFFHQYEMMQQETAVSVLDIFNGFA